MQHKVVQGAAGKEQPFLTMLSTKADAHDGARMRGRWEKETGIIENLLCKSCEAEFSRYETYARSLLYGNGPEPIVKKPLGKSIGPSGGHAAPPLLDIMKVTGVNYDLLKLYQLSLLWRASVATGSFFENVFLGSRHETKIQKLLLDRNPGSDRDYCCAMVDLRHEGKGCEDFSYQPEKDRDALSGQRIYKMILGGYMYIFQVASEPPPEEVRLLGINRAGEMFVLVGDAKSILLSWAKALGAAGKL